jgi:hypothetical protein
MGRRANEGPIIVGGTPVDIDRVTDDIIEDVGTAIANVLSAHGLPAPFMTIDVATIDLDVVVKLVTGHGQWYIQVHVTDDLLEDSQPIQ